MENLMHDDVDTRTFHKILNTDLKDYFIIILPFAYGRYLWYLKHKI